MINQYDNQPKNNIGLDDLGLKGGSNVLWNLNPPGLYEQAICNNEAILTDKHALLVYTGKYTGRSPQDKFTVEEESTKDDIDWGGFNKPISAEVFDNFINR